MADEQSRAAASPSAQTARQQQMQGATASSGSDSSSAASLRRVDAHAGARSSASSSAAASLTALTAPISSSPAAGAVAAAGAATHPGAKAHNTEWKDVSLVKFCCLTAFFSTVENGLFYPFYVLKTREQADARTLRGKSPWSASRAHLRTLLADQGVRGLYRGFVSSNLTAFPAYGVYMGVYSWAKAELGYRVGSSGDSSGLASLYAPFLAGLLADAASVALYVPGDVVVQRLQLKDSPYSGFADACRQIYLADGPAGFFRGFTATFLTSGIASAVWWVLYENIKNELYANTERREAAKRIGRDAGTAAGAATTDSNSISSSPSSSSSSSSSATPSLYDQLTSVNRVPQVVSGFIAGTVTSVLINPLDVVKCWGTGTELLMYDGTTKRVEDIVRDSRAGQVQVLMGDDSTPRTVQPGTEHEGNGMLYSVISDNKALSTWTCNAGHILVLRIHCQPRIRQRSPQHQWEVDWFSLDSGPSDQPAGQRSFIPVERHRGEFACHRDAAEFVEALDGRTLEFECVLADYLGLSRDCQSRCTMFAPARVDFHQSGASLQTRLQAAVTEFGASELVVSDELVRQTAWVLGIWLTDGGDKRELMFSQIAACRESPEHAHTAVLVELEDWFSKVYGVASTGGHLLSTIRLGPVWTALLRSYDLEGHKHMPQDLLTEPATIRQALLAGILDGGGSLRANCRVYAIPNESRDFLVSVQHLARGLGFSAGQIGEEKTIRLTEQEQEQDERHPESVGGFYIDISGVDLPSLPLVLQYKRCPVAPTVASPSDPRSNGFRVKLAGPGTFWGFELDGNYRCLLSDFRVTHNTRLQVQDTFGHQAFDATERERAGHSRHPDARPKYRSLAHGLRRIYRDEGFKGYWRGVMPKIVSRGPLSAMSSLLYEVVMHLSKTDEAKRAEHRFAHPTA